MATKTLYLTSGILTETAPSGPIDTGQGWTVDKKASPNYCVCDPTQVLPSTSFVTTEPSSFSQKRWVSNATYRGYFANANWSLAFKVKCNTYYAQTGVVKMRLWRAEWFDGIYPVTQLTSGWVASSTISFTAANQEKTGTITWSPGGTVSIPDHFIALEIEWSATASGGNNSAIVYFAENEGAAEALTTPDFTEAQWLPNGYWWHTTYRYT